MTEEVLNTWKLRAFDADRRLKQAQAEKGAAQGEVHRALEQWDLILQAIKRGTIDNQVDALTDPGTLLNQFDKEALLGAARKVKELRDEIVRVDGQVKEAHRQIEKIERG